MHRKSLFIAPAIAAVALGLVGLTAQAASAAPATPAHKGAPAPVAHSTAPTPKATSVLSAKPFPGFRQVTSDLLSDPANSQVSGTAACPAGTKLVGGGAVISSSSLSENLNASVPLTDGLTWKVYVNNASSANGTFRVFANCVTTVKAYHVVIGTGVLNNAGTQSSASVTCPATTFPLGGGGFASSGSNLVNLNTSIPLANGWRTDVNNGSTGSNTATAYVVCGKKPTKYAQISGTSTTVNPGAQAFSVATCATGTTALSGGAFSSSGSTSVNLNSTAPSGSSSWISYEDNGLTTSTTVTSYAVCGKTTS